MQYKAVFRCQKFRSSTDNISKFEFLMPVPGRIGLFQIYIMVKEDFTMAMIGTAFALLAGIAVIAYIESM